MHWWMRVGGLGGGVKGEEMNAVNKRGFNVEDLFAEYFKGWNEELISWKRWIESCEWK